MPVYLYLRFWKCWAAGAGLGGGAGGAGRGAERGGGGVAGGQEGRQKGQHLKIATADHWGSLVSPDMLAMLDNVWQ